MNKNLKSVLTLSLGGLAIALAIMPSRTVGNALIALLGSMLAAIVITAIRNLLARSSESGENIKTATPPPVSDPSEQLLEKCVAILLECKLSGLAPIPLSQLEQLVERLIEVLPRLNSEHVGSELTFTVNKIAGEYLQQVTSAYLGLTPESKAGQEAEIISVISGLCAEVNDIRGLLDSQSSSEFKTHARFIRQKFFGENLAA